MPSGGQAGPLVTALPHLSQTDATPGGDPGLCVTPREAEGQPPCSAFTGVGGSLRERLSLRYLAEAEPVFIVRVFYLAKLLLFESFV